MSKFRSKCGYVMVMQTGDEPYEHRLLKDREWIDEYNDFVNSLPSTIIRKKNKNDDFDSLYSLFLDSSVSVLKCPQCGRIYVDINNDNNYFIFKPETWDE